MVSTFVVELLERVSNSGKFQYLARLTVCSALACTFESYSVLEYMYLHLTFEFEVMGLESASWYAGTFAGQLYML